MNIAIFDFEKIGIIEDFYKIAEKQLSLPDTFGNNLDALWDSLTGYIALPVQIKFINMTMNQLEQFDKLIMLFEDAVIASGGDLNFEYYLKIAR